MSDSRCRLYLITPPRIELSAFVKRAEQAFAGGLPTPKRSRSGFAQAGDVGAFQLRLKDASDAEILEAARALIPLCHAHECAFILNDRPDLAAQCGADGVHLGQDDLAKWPIAKARKLLGENRIIGVSAHASRHLAMEAGEEGADYVAFGAFYPTKSKSPEKLAQYGTPKPEIVEWWSEYTVLPSVAIGGMTPANCSALVKAGADFIAAISYVWEHERGPGAAVEEFNEAMSRIRSSG